MMYWIIVVIFSGNLLAAQIVDSPMTQEQCTFLAEFQKVELEKRSEMKVESITCAARLYDIEPKN